MSCPSQSRNDSDDKFHNVPIKAVEWMTLHCISNVELAILSNVCTSWRDVVCQTLEQVFVTSLEKDGDTKKKEEYDEVNRLLLPCMALELLRRGGPHQREEKKSVKITTSQENEETFCLAWFAPVGLQIQSLCINEDDESDDYGFSSSSSISYDDCEQDMSFGPSTTAIGESLSSKHDGQNMNTAAAAAVTNSYPLDGPQRKQNIKEDDDTKERFAPGGVDFYEGSEDENTNKKQRDKKQQKKRYSATTKTELPSSSSAVPTVHFKGIQRILSPTSDHSDGNDSVTSDAYESARLQACVYEWRGYRYATDVLIPLGYATVFIRRVLDLAVNLLQSHSPTSPLTTDEDETARNNNNKTPLQKTSSSNLQKQRWVSTSTEYAHSTFAVRGATLARPDNYCLCLDSLNDAESNESDDRPKREDNELTYTDTVASADKHRRHLYRLKHTRQKIRLRRKKRKEMARLFLPRMIRSARVKNPLIQFDSPSNDVSASNGKVVPSVEGKRSRCIQFLNVNGTHAVFLRTLPFDCGTVKGPITLFLVGVATEDGCFVSGLKCRCEVGHLYPTDSRDMLINMSPICIATDGGSLCDDDKNSNNGGEQEGKADDIVDHEGMKDLWEGVIEDINASAPNFQTTIANSNIPATAAGFFAPSSPPMKNDFSSSYDSSDDSSDDSDSSEGTGYKIHCTCPFQSHNNRNSAIHFSKYHHNRSVASKLANHNRTGGRSSSGSPYREEEEEQEEEEPPPVEEEDIYRGRMGPGLWHCYTVTFDGEESRIRVDGLLEPRQKGGLQEQNNDNDGKESKINSMARLSSSSHTAESMRRRPATLDGLTIGSDHIFDMSLCYGDASDGEGEGAIAELAVFKGRMDLSDVECIERYLMKRHGIPFPPSANTSLNNDTHTHSKVSHQHPNPSSPWQEDEWKRQANALIVQPPPWKIADEAVPLRVAAKHKSVAWHRTNNVTGKVVMVSRIGSKYSTGSSDW